MHLIPSSSLYNHHMLSSLPHSIPPPNPIRRTLELPLTYPLFLLSFLILFYFNFPFAFKVTGASVRATSAPSQAPIPFNPVIVSSSSPSSYLFLKSTRFNSNWFLNSKYDILFECLCVVYWGKQRSLWAGKELHKARRRRIKVGDGLNRSPYVSHFFQKFWASLQLHWSPSYPLSFPSSFDRMLELI